MKGLKTLKPRVAQLEVAARPAWHPSRAARARSESGTGWKPEHRQGEYGAAWRKAREQVLQRDAYQCQACKRAGRLTPAREVDHVLPRFEGGGEELTNLQALCTPCHAAKTAEESKRARGGGAP